jgi:Uma2 family endonuclease
VIGVRPIEESSTDQFLAQWRAILDDSSLQDLPYKIETDESGRIILSPSTNRHALYGQCIIDLLKQHLTGGLAFTEGVVLTRKGIRSPDVVWVSLARFDGSDEVFHIAPEICVEVLSKTNKPKDIKEKTALYFAAGALEVWTCDLEGNMTFADLDGSLERSNLVPNFPNLVELPGRQSKV